MIRKYRNALRTHAFLAVFFISAFFTLPSALALDTGLTNAARGTGLQPEFSTLMGNVIKNVLMYVGVIFFILVIYGGVAWMVSGGNEQRLGTAKKIITAATIGLIIVMLAYSITYFVVQSISTATGDESNFSCYPKDFIGPLPEGATYCN